MRRLLLTTFLILTIAPAQADETEILRRLDAIEKRLNNIESADPMKALLQQGLANLSKKKSEGSAKTDLNVEQPPFSVKILSIRSGGKDILGQPIVDLKFSVTNQGARDIDIVNAFIEIKDRADNTLIRVKWQKNKGMKAGQTATMKGSYSPSMSSDGIETLLEIDRSLLVTSFDVYKIAFAGGEVTKFKDCMLCDF